MPILGVIASAISQALSRIFLSTRSGSVLVTQDQGVTFTTSLSAGQQLNSLSYDQTASTFLVGGNNNTLYSSINGTTWTTRNADFGSNNINAVKVFRESGNTYYIASSTGSLSKISTDLVTWTTITIDHGTQTDASIAITKRPSSFIVANQNYRGIINNERFILRSNVSSQNRDQFSSMYGSSAGVWDKVSVFTPNAFSGPGEFQRVVFGQNIFVGGGYNGQLHTSTDGLSWTARSSNFSTHAILAIDYGNNLWVATGYGGRIRTSTDAITWVTRTSNFGSTNIRTVAYGNSIWLAAGGGGAMRTSTDGITWTTRTSPSSGGPWLTYGNGLWVLGIEIGPSILTSTDTITWTGQTSNFGSTPLSSVGYGNGVFWAGGRYAQVRSSTDGITWTTQAAGMGNSVRGFTYGLGTWVVAGYGLRTTTDLVTWGGPSIHTSPDNGYNSVAYGNGIFVGVGKNSSVNVSGLNPKLRVESIDAISSTKFGAVSNTIYYETSDLDTFTSVNLSWLTRTSNTTDQIESIRYGNGLWAFVSSTNGQIRTSTDTLNWTTQSSNFSSTIPALTLAYANGLFVAGGGSGNLRTSTDGITWTTRTSNVTESITRIVYGNNIWVLAAQGIQNVIGSQIRTSTDAVTWTTRTSNFPTSQHLLAALGYGNGLFVAGANNGSIRTSTDGVSWITRTSTFTNAIRAVDWGNNVWVMAGESTTITSTSTDGISWTTRTSRPGMNFAVRDISYGNGFFLASGEGNEIRSTTDGINWTTLTSAGSAIRIGHGNNLVALGGSSGLVRFAAAEPLRLGIQPEATTVSENIVLTQNKVGYIYNSTFDQYTPFVLNIEGKFKDLSKTDKGYILVGDNGLATWTGRTTNSGTSFSSVYGNGVWLIGDSSGRIFSSPDTITWTTRTSGFGATTVTSIAYSNGLFVASSGTSIRTSTDGITWTGVTSNWPTISSQILGVTYGNGTWVAVGRASSVSTIRTSTDTVTWVTRSAAGGTGLTSVSYGGGVFAAAGYSAIIHSSTDGTTWTARSSNLGNTTLRTISYGNSLWFAGGRYRAAVTSTDAITWTQRDIGIVWGRQEIFGSRFDDNIWLVVGNNGFVGVSTNGITWTTRQTTFGNQRSIAYGNGTWLINSYGANTARSNSNSYFSTDLITWTTLAAAPKADNISDGQIV